MSFLSRIEHMEAQVAFDQLRHQSVERAATGCHKLQNLFAFPFPFKSAFIASDCPLIRRMRDNNFFLSLIVCDISNLFKI